MHLGMVESQVPFGSTVRLSSDLVLRIIMSGVYLSFFFKFGIPNSVMYHFWITVTLTLTSDLVLESLCPVHISDII